MSEEEDTASVEAGVKGKSSICRYLASIRKEKGVGRGGGVRYDATC